MKLELESTTKIVEISVGGAFVPVRVWEGHTESGIPVHCFIARVAVAPEHPLEQFELELKSCKTPSPAIEGIPLRLIL